MAEILTNQEDMDRVFRRIQKDFGKFSKRKEDFAVREIGRIRGDVDELLAEYADDAGVIQRRRAQRVMRDLDALELYLREQGEIIITDIVEESSDWTARRLNRELGLAIGGDQFDRINENVVKYVVDRFGEDGLVLSDRIWAISGEIRDELAYVVRSSIIKGESISAMIPKIRRAYDNETWKIRRVARTESLTAHRGAIAYSAEESEVTRWRLCHAGDNRSAACVA